MRTSPMEWHRMHYLCQLRHRTSTDNGFTLIESMLTLALLGLLVAVSAGSFGARLALARANAVAYVISQLLDEAREGAIRRDTTITVCPADDTGDCLRNGGSQLLAFADHNGDQHRQTTEPLLRRYRPASGHIAVRAAFGERSLRLGVDGSATVNGSLYYCPDKVAPEGIRRVVLGSGGRVLQLVAGDGEVCGE